MAFIDKLQAKTRWDQIPGTEEDYRLLCSNDECSLSCANIRNGNLSVTSIHGNDRHSKILSKNDMVFLVIKFLNTLSPEELRTFNTIFNNEFLLQFNNYQEK